MSVTNVIKVSVVVWTAGMLTAYYARILPQMDATFIAGLLTQTLGALGVEVANKKKEEEENNTPKKAPSIPTTRTPRKTNGPAETNPGATN